MHTCLRRSGEGRCVAATKPDSAAAGAASAGVVTEVSPVVVFKAPGASCDVQSVRNDLPPQAAAADQSYLEEQAAEYERSVAPAEPRRKKLRTPAAAPLTGVRCHYHGCVNILPDAEGSCPAQLFSRPPLKLCCLLQKDSHAQLLSRPQVARGCAHRLPRP